MSTFNNGYGVAKLIATAVFYIVAAILAVLGLWTFSSCSASKQAESSGRTTIVTNDTTHIQHGGTFNFKIKL